MFGKKKASEHGPIVETIRDARVGDVFTITGQAVEYEDSYFIVEKLNRYSSQQSQWFELLGVDGETRLWISWSDKRGLFITATPDNRPIGLSQLGITDDDLIQLDNEQSIDNRITFDGEDFFFKNSGEVFFFEDNEGEGHGHYVWDFDGESGSRVMTVFKWEAQPFHAYVSDVVAADDVTVYKR